MTSKEEGKRIIGVEGMENPALRNPKNHLLKEKRTSKEKISGERVRICGDHLYWVKTKNLKKKRNWELQGYIT